MLLRSGAVKVRLRHSSRARRLRLVLVPGRRPRAGRAGSHGSEGDRQRARRRSRPGWSARSRASSPARSVSRGRASPGTPARRCRCASSRRSARAPTGAPARSSCARPTPRAPRSRSSAGTAARRAPRWRPRSSARRRGLGVAPKTLAVRDQRTRWGSCSERGTLSFSWRLLLAPAWVLDDVVCHELCHLRIANHSQRVLAAVRGTTGRRPIRARGCGRTAASLRPTGRPIASDRHEHDRLRDDAGGRSGCTCRTTTSSRATWSSTGRPSTPASSRSSRSTRAARAGARSASASSHAPRAASRTRSRGSASRPASAPS